MKSLAYPTLLLAACAAAGSDPGDSEAETSTATSALGKSDGAAPTGLWHISSTSWRANDITDLELRPADPVGHLTYVRARCYGSGCAEQIAQTDAYDLVTTSSGKTYVRFWSERLVPNADAAPVIADIYEVRTIAKGIQLRKTYTTRWFSLFTATPSSQCAASGGTTNAGGDCACPDGAYDANGYEAFAPGAGGCIWAPAASETACDDSHGQWTDDESTPIATFCSCGVNRYVGDDGACTDI